MKLSYNQINSDTVMAWNLVIVGYGYIPKIRLNTNGMLTETIGADKRRTYSDFRQYSLSPDPAAILLSYPWGLATAPSTSQSSI
ncbi:hypothetical protein BDV40DRAFT_283636 [Aspergillus tamarii]|uniref:Uncharacterized protein n=1 Tax=Aspergillus tamarii TaxID=41984 RepID=A0A5N6UA74_ASPTM|nr:hypothetical protein BDV40DRAFT_283636 [Aspergillus tamarii]